MGYYDNIICLFPLPAFPDGVAHFAEFQTKAFDDAAQRDLVIMPDGRIFDHTSGAYKLLDAVPSIVQFYGHININQVSAPERPHFCDYRFTATFRGGQLCCIESENIPEDMRWYKTVDEDEDPGPTALEIAAERKAERRRHLRGLDANTLLAIIASKEDRGNNVPHYVTGEGDESFHRNLVKWIMEYEFQEMHRRVIYKQRAFEK